ncbi:MAG: GIY-YIG nuclease family protein [bacterium]|nr:GIY-YIG nuclease family protein [bacterium]
MESYKFYTYILKSVKSGKHYIGHTANLSERLQRHNSGRNRSTRANAPWEIIYFEKFNTKSEAFNREMEIKKYKSGIKFKKLFGSVA